MTNFPHSSRVDVWKPRFDMWPTFTIQRHGPTLHITPDELRREFAALEGLFHRAALELTLEVILARYTAVEVGDEPPIPVETVTDFFAVDEARIQLSDKLTGEYAGTLVFVPNNGFPADSFCDWTTSNPDFDRFLEDLVDALGEVTS